LIRIDKEGFAYFVDRIGDTFRWKGENVSTNEVSEVISQIKGVHEANVYGVAIPGFDGRAGMASLVVADDFDFALFYQRISKDLPAYAAPIFVRIDPQVEITTTFKQKKVELVNAGFDPSIVPNVYFRKDVEKKFIKITPEIFKKILAKEYKI